MTSQNLLRGSRSNDGGGANATSGTSEDPTSTNDSSTCSYPKRASRDQLMQHMRHKVANVNGALMNQRLSSALTCINEIPQQLEQMLQQSANNVTCNMQNEVDAIQDIVIDSVTASHADPGDAAQSIAKIPGLVKNEFDQNFANAMTSVRIHVDDVIQGLEADDGGMANNWMVRQIQAIPGDLRQITAAFAKKAAEDSQHQVELQLDQLRRNAPEASLPGGMLNLAQAQCENALTREQHWVGMEATMTAETCVGRALDAVQQENNMDKGMTNRVVMDVLLRAKVGGGSSDCPFSQTRNLSVASRGGTGIMPQFSSQSSLKICCPDASDGQSMQAFRADNPGSIGHPELCSRPCLFFAEGQCENGSNCLFCHGTHAKRPAHLDKRNREMLQRLDLADRLAIMAPILRTKLSSTRDGGELVAALDQACRILPASDQAANSERSRRGRDTRTLFVALKCMAARSLLALLNHGPKCEDSAKHRAIKDFLHKCDLHRYPEEEAILGDAECIHHGVCKHSDSSSY